MPFVEPGNYSKNLLDRAGDRIRNGTATDNDNSILENWRASHLYILNTFQATLRARRSKVANPEYITIAQRLKRRPTIIDKLKREPDMNLSRMHDIAGCRIIFPSIKELVEFRNAFHQSRAKHEITSNKDKYNYIQNPKNTGYRGIHDVYRYNVSSTQGQKWNGQRIEIQYRTKAQHAWATAVEISDIINSTRIKFSDAGKDISDFFLFSSEVIARALEGQRGYLHDKDDRQVLQEFKRLENELKIIEKLRNVSTNEFHEFARSYKLFILINHTSGSKQGQFEAEGFPSNTKAIERYAQLEKLYSDSADIVLVGSGQQESIKIAYTNYFSDASDFIRCIDKSILALER